MITADTIDKIMDAARIDEVIGEFVPLKKRGVNLIGLCPFHNEKTPSFNVSAAKGIYKCFGCGKGGNAVSFLMDHEHFSYPEALRYLAKKYSIELVEEKPSEEQQQLLDEKESLFNLSAFAQKYFEEQLHQSEEGKAIALSYLKERGFTLEMIKKFGLGYCPGKWDQFSQTALKNAYKKEYLLKSSLSKTKDQLLYDTFRGRVMFPIHNLSGRVLGFGGRLMSDEKNRPKYINSAESEIYHKSKVLYGLYFAKSAMVSQDNCYLVEGYTDVISLHQAGISNVIATSGTSLTGDQIKLIRRYTTNLTLLFDGDPAGIKAAFRGIDMILEEGLNVRIVLFPDGEDPDSYARKNRPVEVQRFVETQAADFISFKTELLLAETANDPIRKASLIKDIAQSISLIPEAITRTLYIQKCSNLMQVDEKLMVDEISKLRRQRFLKRKQAESSGHQPDEGPVIADRKPPVSSELTEQNDSQEKELIRLLLHYGERELRFEVENEDKQMEEVEVSVVDFVASDLREDQLQFDNQACQAIFELFDAARQEDKTPAIKQFTEHPSPEIRTLAVDLLSTRYSLSKNWETRHRIYVVDEEENLRAAVMHALYAFKLKKLEEMIRETQEAIRRLASEVHIDEEDMQRKMEMYRDLTFKRQQFAAALNRVVTK
ncbi:MAG: DNA primase [Bacteroidales bacterium]|nr:DNA primase [Bacteroidales bacterium]